MIVAIDGPAGVGKSSIARMIADKLGLYYLNSGNFYRGVTYKVLTEGLDPTDSAQCIRAASEAVFDVVDEVIQRTQQFHASPAPRVHALPPRRPGLSHAARLLRRLFQLGNAPGQQIDLSLQIPDL